MPQLNPHPWFIILVFSWVIFLSILPKKVTHHLFNGNPTPKSVKKTKSKSWNWPWT